MKFISTILCSDGMERRKNRNLYFKRVLDRQLTEIESRHRHNEARRQKEVRSLGADLTKLQRSTRNLDEIINDSPSESAKTTPRRESTSVINCTTRPLTSSAPLNPKRRHSEVTVGSLCRSRQELTSLFLIPPSKPGTPTTFGADQNHIRRKTLPNIIIDNTKHRNTNSGVLTRRLSSPLPGNKYIDHNINPTTNLLTPSLSKSYRIQKQNTNSSIYKVTLTPDAPTPTPRKHSADGYPISINYVTSKTVPAKSTPKTNNTSNNINSSHATVTTTTNTSTATANTNTNNNSDVIITVTMANGSSERRGSKSNLKTSSSTSSSSSSSSSSTSDVKSQRRGSKNGLSGNSENAKTLTTQRNDKSESGVESKSPTRTGRRGSDCSTTSSSSSPRLRKLSIGSLSMSHNETVVLVHDDVEEPVTINPEPSAEGSMFAGLSRRRASEPALGGQFLRALQNKAAMAEEENIASASNDYAQVKNSITHELPSKIVAEEDEDLYNKEIEDKKKMENKDVKDGSGNDTKQNQNQNGRPRSAQVTPKSRTSSARSMRKDDATRSATKITNGEKATPKPSSSPSSESSQSSKTTIQNKPTTSKENKPQNKSRRKSDGDVLRFARIWRLHSGQSDAIKELLEDKKPEKAPAVTSGGNDSMWEAVRKCRYIRAHNDSDNATEIADIREYVFGPHEIDPSS